MPVYRFDGPKNKRQRMASIETEDINGIMRKVPLYGTIELSTAQLDELDEYAKLSLSSDPLPSAPVSDNPVAVNSLFDENGKFKAALLPDGLPTGPAPAATRGLIAKAVMRSMQPGIAPGGTDIMAISFTVPDERPITVRARIPFILNKTAAGIASLLLTDDANVLKDRVQQSCGINEQRYLGEIERTFEDLPVGMTVMLKLRGQAPAGATFDAYADPTYRGFLRADIEEL